MIKKSHKDLRSEMLISDGKLTDRIVELQVELTNKVDKFQNANDIRLDKLHLEVHIFRDDIKNKVTNEDYVKTVAKLDDLQRGLEGELDNIQTHVRENKDKQQELIKRFQQLIESDDMKSALNDASEKILGISTPSKVLSRNNLGTPLAKDFRDSQESGENQLREQQSTE